MKDSIPFAGPNKLPLTNGQLQSIFISLMKPYSMSDFRFTDGIPLDNSMQFGNGTEYRLHVEGHNHLTHIGQADSL